MTQQNIEFNSLMIIFMRFNMFLNINEVIEIIHPHPWYLFLEVRNKDTSSALWN